MFKALRKRAIWILLSLFLLPVLLLGIWYGRQVRQQRLDHALIEAIKKQDTPKAIALLDQGADANAEDKAYEPKSLWSLLEEFWNRLQGFPATEEAKPTLSALLIETVGDWQKDHYVEFPDNPTFVQALLEHGANPNVRSESDTTPLINACYYHRVETVRLLLEHGADPNAKSLEGKTPLMAACQSPHEQTMACLHLLIAYGADVNLTNGLKQSALMYVILFSSGKSSHSTETIGYLLRHGAKVSLRDGGLHGRSPLDWARGYNDKVAIPLLEAALKKEQAEQHTTRTGTK